MLDFPRFSYKNVLATEQLALSSMEQLALSSTEQLALSSTEQLALSSIYTEHVQDRSETHISSTYDGFFCLVSSM